MWPTLWKPGKEELFPLVQLRESLDDLFEGYFPTPIFRGRKNGHERTFLPALDVRETEDSLIVETELPGMEAKDFTVQVAGDLLTIRGERKAESEEKTKTYHRKECSYGSFERQVRLPADVNAEKSEAEFRNGILKLTFARKPEAKSKTVVVKVK